MTKAKSAPKTYEPTDLPGGVPTLIKIWEELRDRNDDGYVSKCGGLLAVFKHRPGLPTPPECKGTVCSPFTATVTGMAFDPKYPRKDLDGDPYVPMCNAGNDELPYQEFYGLHKDAAAQSVIKYGLGTKVDEKKLRRGDVVNIDWVPPPGGKGGGHAVFVWDVHLDANGDVDAFQYISSNGHILVGYGGWGVSIGGCSGKGWFTGSAAKTQQDEKEVEKKDKKTGVVTKVKSTFIHMGTRGDIKKGKNPMFVDSDDVVKEGTWHAVPSNKPDFSTPKKKEAWLATFRVRPQSVIHSGPWSVQTLMCARFNYKDPPPDPKCMRDGAAPPPKPGHTEAPAVLVKGDDIKKDAAAPKKVPPKPAKQEKDRAVDWQHFAEQALKVFFERKWIESDPGKADDINDGKTQAALKEFQKMFDLVVDGILGKKTTAALQKHLPAAQTHHDSQKKLRDLHKGKKISTDPGPVDGTNHAQTKSAVEEFQKANGLKPTKVPDADTQKKLAEVHAQNAPTPDAPGLDPHVKHLYWIGNTVDVGGKATLRLHSVDLKSCEECEIHLIDEVSKKDVVATVKLSVDAEESQVDVPMPTDFGAGAVVQAKVVTESAGEITTIAPMTVGGTLTELADWRPYIGQDSVPDDVIDKIKRNRARYPQKTFRTVMYQHDKKGNVLLDKKTGKPLMAKYGGVNHYDYRPPKSHQDWAVDYFQKTRVDVATTKVDKLVARAFVYMLRNEGLPASFQTYDDQIITWGVGFGGKGDGAYVFDEMNKDPKLKRLLDDLGMNYGGGRFHVVDVAAKKVISTDKKLKNPHYAPLDSVRQQNDLMYALVGMSEDRATRVPVSEAQWTVYRHNSTRWPGQDRVESLALYFMITHMHHWLPAMGNAVHVDQEFTALGATETSHDVDKKLAQRAASEFVKYTKVWSVAHKQPGLYPDVYGRTRTNLWAQYREDAKKEGYDPGELEYADDVPAP